MSNLWWCYGAQNRADRSAAVQCSSAHQSVWGEFGSLLIHVHPHGRTAGTRHARPPHVSISQRRATLEPQVAHTR